MCCSTAACRAVAWRSLWVTVFNLFAVAVFWSFMADVFSNAQARSYYGYIGAAGTLGAFLGPVLTRVLVERIGIAHLMLVSAGFWRSAWFACCACGCGPLRANRRANSVLAKCQWAAMYSAASS